MFQTAAHPFGVDPLAQAVRRALGLATAGAFLLTSPALLAQQTEPTETLETVTVEAEALSIVSEGSERYRVPLTSTATRLDLTPRETPQSVSTVTRAQIDDFNLDSVNDALASTPGVMVERVETDRTYYTARGFDITNFQFDGLGIPLVYKNVQGDIDTAIYDRIEVVRGSTGLLSGTGNPSAAINFVRKRPTPEAEASVSATAGSWDQRRLDLDVSGPLVSDGSVRGRFVAANESKDSYLDRQHRERRVLYGVIEAELAENTELAIGHSWQTSDTDSPLWGALPLFDSEGEPTNYDVSTSTAADWSYWNNEDSRSFIELDHYFASDWQASAALNYIHVDSDSKLFYVYGTPDQETGQGLKAYPSLYNLESEQWVADLYAKGPLTLAGRDHQLMAGVQWSKSRLQDISNYGQGIGDPVPPLESWDGSYPEPSFDNGVDGSDWTDRQLGVYGAARLNFTDRFTGILGSRVSRFDSTGGSYGNSKDTSYDAIVTPYAGLVYDVSDSISMYASYTEIFQPQTEVDINRNRLDPIDGINYEAGIKADVFDDADASLAVFRVEQNNLAEAVDTIPGSVDTYYKGVNGLTSKGIEATLAGQLAEGWQASVGYTYLEIEDAEGEEARTFTPKQMIRAVTSYRLPFREEVKVGARLSWQDDIYRDQASNVITRQEDYALVDLMASYDINNNLTASLNVNNVTDEKYLTSLYWAQGFYGAPRSVMGNLTWRY